MRSLRILSVLLLLGAPLAAATDRPLRSIIAQPAQAAAGADVVFVVGGDNRPSGYGAPLPRAVPAIFKEVGLIHPDFVLWSGDTVYGYCDTKEELAREYDAFFAAAKLGGVPLFNAPGNHEIHEDQDPSRCAAGAKLCPAETCSQAMFEERFGPLYGSYDFAGLHLIALDTDVPSQQNLITGDQLTWLETDLEKNKDARAIFLFSHSEFFSSPLIDEPDGKSHPAVQNQAELHEIFRRYPVKAVFSGHEHVFWREPADQHDGIEYFVSGGAGAPLYAPPDHGGFTHYLVVRVTGDKISYDVIEPGRLYAEGAKARSGEAARFWVVNTNDTDLPLRGITAEVKGVSNCSKLTATTDLHKNDGTPVSIPISISSFQKVGKTCRLTLAMPTMPKRVSVPVVIRKQS
jgi:hypothetical protein